MIKNQPDILFFPQKSYFELAFIVLRFMKIIKTQLITYVVHDINEKKIASKKIPEFILRKAILTATSVIANCENVSNNIRKVMKLNSSIIYDGIDTRYFYPKFKKNNIYNKPLNVLYAGSFQGKKRPDVIIKFAAKYPNIIFRLAGSGINKQSCEALARHLDCNNIIFLGLIPQSVLGDEMRLADIFLFPSLDEGHPQVLGQAAACGLPSVAMQCYNPRYVIHKKTGFLANDDHELNYYFHLLINNKETRDNFSQQAILHAKQFNWDNITLEWSALFEQTVATANASK